MEQEEIDLIMQIQNWNLDLFTKLYNNYFHKIYTFVLMKVDWNIQLAEDVTATTFMKAFENINKFSFDKKWSSFKAWIYNIAYHCLLDTIKRNNEKYFSDENDVIYDSGYVDYFQKHIQVEQILSYLEQLWSEKKDLFILRIWNNLSYDEISKILWKRSSTLRKDFSKLIKKTTNHFKYWLCE